MKITLKTLPQATAQQVFDQVAVHLLTQGVKSLDADENCMYKGVNHTKCAAGSLIGTDEYRPEFELTSWDDLAKDEFVPTNQAMFIRKLQIIHDQRLVNEWPEELTELAEREHLSAQIVEDWQKGNKPL